MRKKINHRLPAPRRIYQKHINKETNVASGGANPIQNNEVGSIWLNSHDKGMRKKKVAIRLYYRFDVCKFFRQEMHRFIFS